MLRKQRIRIRRHLFARSAHYSFVVAMTKKNRSIRRSLRGGRDHERRCASYTNARRAAHHRFENGEISGKTTDQKHFRKKNTSKDGTVFGIVSRAIRPRRRCRDRDYLRVCRQRRVEFGTSLALLVIVSVVLLLALCALGNLISSFVSFVSLSFTSSSLVGN